MTLDEIKNMAREAGAHKDEPCTECGDINPLWEFGTEELCQFAWRIVAIEREACAKVCEQVAENVTYQRNSQEAADKCADAIRARDQ